MQNRISQRNYRNKIRVRLEKLEAAVGAKAKEELLASEEVKPPEAPGAENGPPGSVEEATSAIQDKSLKTTTDPCDPCSRCMSDFLSLSDTDLEFMSRCHCPQVQGLMPSLGNAPVESIGPMSEFMESAGPESIYMDFPSPVVAQPQSPTVHNDTPKPGDPSVGMGSPALGQRCNPLPPSADISNPQFGICPNSLPERPYGQFSYAYPLSMMAPMVPLGFFAVPSPCIQDESGRPRYGLPGHQSMQPPYLHSQQYIWIPTPVVGLPMEAIQPHETLSPGSGA
ncbi:MAG: hypothetical protein M1840_007091 [Geoglossum simile]|nr:MAG: hypothetical protein M1840_007091 [Geoglossum simile]